MLSLTRVTKMFIMPVLAVAFFVLACYAENVTVFSERYTSDLEHKQAMLGSVMENYQGTSGGEEAMSGKVKAIEDRNKIQPGLENINLGQIMSSTEKLAITVPNMSGTLSPQSRGERALPDKKITRQ